LHLRPQGAGAPAAVTGVIFRIEPAEQKISDRMLTRRRTARSRELLTFFESRQAQLTAETDRPHKIVQIHDFDSQP
jgi:hypothetical protein